MSNQRWKNFLLKCGVPLEYEVRQILAKKGFVGDYEYTYFRRDENKIMNEFSYDIDVAYMNDRHFFDLMVECKYRHESTKWLFVPDNVSR